MLKLQGNIFQIIFLFIQKIASVNLCEEIQNTEQTLSKKLTDFFISRK